MFPNGSRSRTSLNRPCSLRSDNGLFSEPRPDHTSKPPYFDGSSIWVGDPPAALGPMRHGLDVPSPAAGPILGQSTASLPRRPSCFGYRPASRTKSRSGRDWQNHPDSDPRGGRAWRIGVLSSQASLPLVGGAPQTSKFGGSIHRTLDPECSSFPAGERIDNRKEAERRAGVSSMRRYPGRRAHPSRSARPAGDTKSLYLLGTKSLCPRRRPAHGGARRRTTARSSAGASHSPQNLRRLGLPITARPPIRRTPEALGLIHAVPSQKFGPAQVNRAGATAPPLKPALPSNLTPPLPPSNSAHSDRLNFRHNRDRQHNRCISSLLLLVKLGATRGARGARGRTATRNRLAGCDNRTATDRPATGRQRFAVRLAGLAVRPLPVLPDGGFARVDHAARIMQVESVVMDAGGWSSLPGSGRLCARCRL